jgi:hypothetical protein
MSWQSLSLIGTGLQFMQEALEIYFFDSFMKRPLGSSD